MALYEIDTIKQSIKKYAVVLTAGLAVGLYLSNCTSRPSNIQSNSIQANSMQNTEYKPRELTRDEQRLKVFETYTRP